MRQDGTLKSLLGDAHPSWPLWFQLVFFSCIWGLYLWKPYAFSVHTHLFQWEGLPNGPSSCQVLVEGILSVKWSMAASLCLFRADVGWGGVHPVGVQGPGRPGFFGIREALLLLKYPYRWGGSGICQHYSHFMFSMMPAKPVHNRLL